MIEPATPKFQWGQRVRTLVDLLNDGTYPDVPENELLASAGDVGEVVQVGTHVESNTPVYMVEFASKRVIGCVENEISSLS